MEGLKEIPKLLVIIAPFTLFCTHQLISNQIKKSTQEFHDSYYNNRDTTRPGNKSFGLNYGFKTDTTIEEALDTGDLLFMQHICWKSLSMPEMFHCYYRKISKSLQSFSGFHKSDYDSVGLLLRDKSGPRVLFYSSNQIYDLEYGEVLSLPFFQDISARKLRTKQPGLGNVGIEFRAQTVNQKIENGYFDFSDPAELIVKYWKYAELAKDLEDFQISVENIDCARPGLLKNDLAEYTEPIILRTELSKLEVKNY